MTIQPTSRERFNFFLPATLQKAKDKQGKELYQVGGIISDDSTDSDGENLDYTGFDFTDFNFINWNHSKEPKDIIGEPISWKNVPGKGVWMQGEIYPDSEIGMQAVRLMKALENSKRGNKLGWSVEGQVIERDLINPKKVKKAKITAVALCPFPKNGNTIAELIKKGFTGDSVFQDANSLEFEAANGGEVETFIIDVIDADGDRVTVDKAGNIAFRKAVTVEEGKAVVKESVEGTKKDLTKAKILYGLIESIHTIVCAHKEGLCSDEVLRKAKMVIKF